MFFVAWLVAEFSQSAVLYPPAFAFITRWYGDRRVGPLTTVTLVGGLASTVFAPLIAFLIDTFGRRASYVVMAGILAVVTVPLHIFFLNGRWTDTVTASEETSPVAEIGNVTRSRQFRVLQVTMAVATFTLFAVTVLAGAARGCHTLLQATAVSDRWGISNFGAVNGVFTAPMTFVGALAPVAGSAIAGLLGGYPLMAVVMAVLLSTAALVTRRT